MTNNVSIALRRAFNDERRFEEKIEGKRRIEVAKLDITVSLAEGVVRLAAIGEEEYFVIPLDNKGMKQLAKEFKHMAQAIKPGHIARIKARAGRGNE